MLSSVLDILFPPRLQRALNVLAVATVDVHDLFQFECLQLDWYTRWWFAVAGPPLTLLLLVAVRWG